MVSVTARKDVYSIGPCSSPSSRCGRSVWWFAGSSWSSRCWSGLTRWTTIGTLPARPSSWPFRVASFQRTASRWRRDTSWSWRKTRSGMCKVGRIINVVQCDQIGQINCCQTCPKSNKSPNLVTLDNFCKGVKIDHFSCEVNFGQLL